MPSLGPITRGILIAWAAVWIASFLVTLSAPAELAWAWLDPAAILAGRPGALPGALGYVLVHDPTRTLHLLLNALMFAFFAPEVERLWPGRRFLLFLLAAALAGAAAAVGLAALLPRAMSAPVIGGSGLVAATLAASAAVYPGRRVSLILFSCRLSSLVLVLVLLDALFLVGALAGRPSTTANQVHLAGYAAGWLWAGGAWRRGWSPAAWAEKFAARRALRRREKQERLRAAEDLELDRILAKIGSRGIGSLDDAERLFLEKRSRRKK